MLEYLARGDGDISIHTLRMEGDRAFSTVMRRWMLFQSTPSAWRVTLSNGCVVERSGFQSTPSAWRVTGLRCYDLHWLQISIHTLRVEGDLTVIPTVGWADISIHTLRVEGDP